jgi:serine/threonine protein phosphatase PrpC
MWRTNKSGGNVNEMDIGKYTDIGKRDLNEDGMFAIETNIRIGRERFPMHILGVADGLGGYEGGEVASSFVCQKMDLLRDQGVVDISVLENLCKQFTLKLHKNLMAMKYLGEYSKMGTTLTFGLVIENNARITNVGDSRAYLFRKGKLKPVTKDHSLVQELLDKGVIDEDEVFGHPQSHVITQYLGLDKEIKPDTYNIELQSGDIMVFSTDGFHDTLKSGEIEELVDQRKKLGAQELAKTLVQVALNAGARDNVSVVVGIMK